MVPGHAAREPPRRAVVRGRWPPALPPQGGRTQVSTSTAPPLRGALRRLPGAKVLRDGHVLYWWTEILAIGIFYAVYSSIRNAAPENARLALKHALRLIDLQKALGIYHERAINQWALDLQPVVVASNYFYGSLHFVVTIGVGIFLFRRWPDDYPFWRNTLGIATAIALIGFYFWPLMPPRLLPETYGYVDTLAKYPTLWAFNSGAIKSIANQFAAMPSIHCVWALWCACILVPRLRHTWAKVLAALYPVLTVSVIVITANHYFLDAVGGFATLGIGCAGARLTTRAGRGPAVRTSGA
ncbi:MAG: phosphatase PAP2 family protein [Actinobacteria bacterium]|nr:phosphatase PAP2 family protein [Actinomycetota bacterium]